MYKNVFIAENRIASYYAAQSYITYYYDDLPNLFSSQLFKYLLLKPNYVYIKHIFIENYIDIIQY